MTAIVKRPIDVWRDRIQMIRVQIEKALPDQKLMTVERFVQQTMVAFSKTPALMECTPESVLQSVIALAGLGLDPSGALGSGYLVKFKDQCTPVPGYRGLIDLAVRSGDVRGIKAEVVFWGDELDIEEGDRPRLHHKPLIPTSREEEEKLANHRSETNVRGAYAVATMAGGNKQFCYMTFRELEAIRLRAPGGRSDRTPWKTDRVAMYQKCPIRRLVKQLPLSPVKASLLMRAEQLEEENERLVTDMGSEDPEEAQKNTGAESLRAALKKKAPETPEDAEFVSTDQYVGPLPPDDVKLPTLDDQKE
jgi:phage RecT family recombinase